MYCNFWAKWDTACKWLLSRMRLFWAKWDFFLSKMRLFVHSKIQIMKGIHRYIYEIETKPIVRGGVRIRTMFPARIRTKQARVLVPPQAGVKFCSPRAQPGEPSPVKRELANSLLWYTITTLNWQSQQSMERHTQVFVGKKDLWRFQEQWENLNNVYKELLLINKYSNLNGI